MLKQILNLEGAQELGRNEQKSIHGGIYRCNGPEDCQVGFCCSHAGTCFEYEGHAPGDKCHKDPGNNGHPNDGALNPGIPSPFNP